MTSAKNRLRDPSKALQHKLELHRLWLDSCTTEGERFEVGDDILDLSGLCLDDINLSLAGLEDVDFSGSSLRGALLLKTELVGARFDGCDLREADFSGAQLGLTRFVDAERDGALFDDADLRGVVWTREQSDALARGAKDLLRERFPSCDP